MLFEKTSRDPLINCVSDVKNEESDSGFIFFDCPFDGFEEELNETFKWILIHVVDDTKWDTQEIQHGALCSDRSVNFSLSVNVNFCNFSYFWLLLNLVGGDFGLFQIVDKFLIVQNRSGVGFWQLFQQRGFEFIQDDLELILLLDQLLFLNLQFVLFNIDNHCQQLLFKTWLSDNKVDDCTLCCNFRSEMRIGQFCHQEQLELRIVIDDFTTKLQWVTTSFLDNSTWQQWVKCGFDFFLDTFKQHSPTLWNVLGQFSHPVLLVDVDWW